MGNRSQLLPAGNARALLQLMRPWQWAKNLIILTAPFFDGKLLPPVAWQDYLVVLAVFCLASAAVYAFNDAQDASQDRIHPSKRLRPVAAGIISPRLARMASLLYSCLALGLSLYIGVDILWLTAGYLLLNILYTLWLKAWAGADVLTVAAGFLIRTAAGAQTAQVQNFSIWLYICIFLLAVLLSIGKRHSETAHLGADASRHRPSLHHLSLRVTSALIWICGAGLGLTYAWYALAAPTRMVPSLWMGLTIPFAWFPLGYYMKVVLIDQEGENPIRLILRKPPLWLGIGIYFTIMAAWLYFWS